MRIYYDISMTTVTFPSSTNSSKEHFSLGHKIRDSIFYFEDLMGDQNDLPVLHNQEIKQETELDFNMTNSFDEDMSESQNSIHDSKREETIKALLSSIEAFQKLDI